MTAHVTLIGLVPETHFLEDIRTYVPYRMAVLVSAPLAYRSRDLQIALRDRMVMQICNVLPAGSVYRGAGAVPAPGNPNPVPAPPPPAKEPSDQWKYERAALLREIESSKIQATQLQTMNATLQTLLTTMSGQLTAIQQVLGTLKLQGVAVPSTVDVFGSETPMFIPDFIKGDASEVSIAIPENKVETDLSGARGALRALRGKS
jgi:hypothetical protein